MTGLSTSSGIGPSVGGFDLGRGRHLIRPTRTLSFIVCGKLPLTTPYSWRVAGMLLLRLAPRSGLRSSLCGSWAATLPLPLSPMLEFVRLRLTGVSVEELGCELLP